MSTHVPQLFTKTLDITMKELRLCSLSFFVTNNFRYHHMDNHLKRYRRTSQLAQNDIAFLLGMDDSSYISKIELGKRRPNLDTLVMYCLLFDTSLQDLVPEHFNVIRKKIVDGIELLLPLLQDDFSQFTEDRIQALVAIQKKLRDTPLP